MLSVAKKYAANELSERHLANLSMRVYFLVGQGGLQGNVLLQKQEKPNSNEGSKASFCYKTGMPPAHDKSRDLV